MKKSIMTFLIICFIFFASFVGVLGEVNLVVNVKTDKNVYNIGETVHITGSVTLDGTSVSNALVAIQVNYGNKNLIYRTLSTGSIPPTTWKINIIEVYLGDSLGNKITKAIKGRDYTVWIVYRNTQTYPIQATLTFTIYDSSNFPMYSQIALSTKVEPGGPFFVACSWRVPAEAELGIATIYANAYSDLPQNKGWPHCPEKAGTFNIVSTTSTVSIEKSLSQTQSAGNFYTSFYLPTNGRVYLGNYIIYASTLYISSLVGLPGFNFTIFKVKLDGDLNNDGVVDIYDCVIIALAYGSSMGNPNWNPKADVNGDGIVDIFDMVIVALNYGKSAKF